MQVSPSFASSARVVKLDVSLVATSIEPDETETNPHHDGALQGDGHGSYVAEGVESVEERECLGGIGCDLLQGHLFRGDRANLS